MVLRSLICLVAISGVGGSAVGDQAMVATCVPDTLGSSSFRASQTWELQLGLIVQPSSRLCLSVGNGSLSPLVQGAPPIELLPCSVGGGPGSENQSWVLKPSGQIALSDGTGIGKCGQADCCVDVPGYSRTSGTALHLWECAPSPLPPSPPCTHGPCPTADNERWTWEPYGALIGVQSGLCLATATTEIPHTCSSPIFNTTRFCDTTLSPEARAAALVAGANLSTLVSNLAINGNPILPAGFAAQGVVPPTFHEALHGVCCDCGRAHTTASGYTSTGCPTSFPHALALSATFNRSLWGMVGGVIGVESRALRNQNGQGCRGAFFAPNVNLYRDPRWGRGMEVPGEDPMVSGEYGREFVHSMQARNGSRQRAMCMPKHWLAYDIEGRRGDPTGFDRSSFNAVVSNQTLMEYYLPAFHATIRAGQASGVMCSTNAINGIDACMNPLYNKGFLRHRFNFTGAIVTDGDSCGNANCARTVAALNPACKGCASLNQAGNTPTCPAECGAMGAQQCLDGGTDIELGTTIFDFAEAAVTRGILNVSTVVQSNIHLYSNMIRAGLYDSSPDDVLGAGDVDTQRARQIAFEAATDAMVLLKNENQLLPLLPRSGRQLKVALIGPHLNSTTDLLSSLAYTVNRATGPPFVTIEHAFRTRAASSSSFTVSGSALGCDIVAGCPTADTAAVAAAVQGADVVLAFVGLHPASGAPNYPGYGTVCAESEAQDRLNITLCGQQQAILEVAKAGGAPLVAVMINGGTIALDWLKVNADAILNAWYPGQAGGAAVAAVVFGDRAPSGRLPVTIYDETVLSKRAIGNMDIRSDGGMTYMHYRGTPVYPFGWGLAYTTWSASIAGGAALATTTSALASDYDGYYSPASAGNNFRASVALTVAVTNAGARVSSVVTQVFASRVTPLPGNAATAPLRQLVGFARVADLAPGETKQVSVGLVPLALCRVDVSGDQWAEPARWALSATVDGRTFMNATLSVTGDRVRVMAWPASSEYM